MRERINYANAEKRMLCIDDASAYIGMGKSRTREIMEELGAKRKIGRRVVYDKKVIDEWLDSLAADQEREE